MNCLNCQTDNRDDARFCTYCGNPFTVTCPQCGRTEPVSAKFCDHCGHALFERASTPAKTFPEPSTHTPKVLADKILMTRKSVEGERKRVTVLFIDVVGFTSMSERLDPEEVHGMMDRWFKVLMDHIYRHEGIITHFAGDGVMALFGAPIAHEDHAQRACHAAIAIQKAMNDFGAQVWMDYGIEFSARTGINSGLVVVGTIGDDLRMDYTALGDTINLASRMQATASPGSILASQHTHALAKDFFTFDSAGKATVKGKTDPIETYVLVGTSGVETRFAAAVARGLTVFVGRDRELTGLETAFEKTVSGNGQVTAVIGEAGVGKSRLLLEFKKSISGKHHRYLEGGCFHFGGSMAYLPILDILRSYFSVPEGTQEQVIKRRIGKALEELGGDLFRIQPPLHELLSLTVEDGEYLKLEPKLRRALVFEAVKDLLIRIGQIRPLVLAIEDLHWIDKTTDEFLSYLIDRLPKAHILLILLYRPEYAHSWDDKPYYNRIGLGQLPAAASATMVQSLLSDAEVASELREFIVGKGGGNPLFMEELTSTLLESGYITKTDNVYRLASKIWEIQVPDTVQGIIAARMDRLETSCKRTMQIASVIGREFSQAVLTVVAGSPDELKGHLLDLQASDFIYEKNHSLDEEYVFKHVLVQEVAYGSLLLARRREVHEKIGAAIELLHAERLEEFYEILAYHYARSENREEAFRYLRLAGIKAARGSSLWEAFRFFREAIAVLKKQQITSQNAAAQVEIGTLMVSPMLALGFPEDSLYILQNGESLAKDMGDVRSFTILHSAVGLYFSIKGDTMRGLQHNEECYLVAQRENDVELMAPVAFDLFSNYTARGEFVKIAAMAPEIIKRLEESDKKLESFGRGYNIYCAMCAFEGFSLSYLGEYDKGRSSLEKGLQFALKVGNLYSLGLIEIFYGYSYCHQGDGASALPHFEKGIQYLEKGQIFVLLGLAWTGIGWSYYFTGQAEKALPYMERGLKIHLDSSITYDLSVHYWFLSVVHCDLGHFEKARTYGNEAIRLAEANHEIYYEGSAKVALGWILGRRSKRTLKKAEGTILEGIGILDSLKIRPQVGIGHFCLAEVYGRQNKLEKAYQSLTIAREIFTACRMDNWLARADAAMAPFQQS